MKQQLLIIDDSVKIHPLIKAILAQEPVEIESATDPKTGLVLAASMHPDLILLDIDMPEMNGFETCRRLRADPATADCPIIFLTAHNSVTDRVEGFNLGAVDYVTKPFHHAELTARVRGSLRTNGVIRTLEEKALIDPLTGLGNRAMFNRRIEAETCLRMRHDYPLSIVLIAIDNFKQLTETYGRSFGDRVLPKIGTMLAEQCRKENVTCRLGEEEFAVITPYTNRTEAVTLSERLRTALSAMKFKPEGVTNPLLAGKDISITGSFAVAEASSAFDRSMFQRADDALYRSRQVGPNRIVVAPAETGADSAGRIPPQIVARSAARSVAA